MLDEPICDDCFCHVRALVAGRIGCEDPGVGGEISQKREHFFELSLELDEIVHKTSVVLGIFVA